MKVRVFPGGDDASALYRLLLPMEACRVKGVNVQLGKIGEIDADTDVAVMQRPARAVTLDVIRKLQANHISVHIDIDDDFDNLATNHGAYANYQDRKEYVHQACKMADLVTCSTPALVRKYGYGHGLCIRNYVPSSYLKVEPKQVHPGSLWVGWTGSLRAHPNDLQATHGVLPEVLTAGTEFAHMGDPRGVAEALKLKRDFLKAGYVPIDVYPKVYASFDVAIVPLEQSSFNTAKSWLKGLEAAALGVPFVASQTDEYLKLAAMGAGLVASTKKEWKQHLNRLIRNRLYREAMADSGKETARRLTIEENWPLWLDAYRQASQARARDRVSSRAGEKVAT